MVRTFMNEKLITKEEQEEYEFVMSSTRRPIGLHEKGKECEENKSKKLQRNVS